MQDNDGLSLRFTPMEHSPLRAASVLTAFLAFLGLGSALGSRAIYDHVLSSHSLSSLTAISIGLFIIVIIDTGFRIIKHYWIEAVSQHYDVRLSGGLFHKLLHTKMSAMTRSSVATSLFREFEAVRDLRSSVISTAWVDGFSIIIFLIAIGIIAGWLVLVPLLGLLSILISFWGQKRIERLSMKSQATNIARQSLLQEAVYGIEDVKLSNAESVLVDEMQELTRQSAEDGTEIRHLASIISSIVGAIGSIVQTGITVFGAMMAIDGQITTGTMIAASILSGRVMMPCNSLAAMAMKIGRARTAEKTVMAMANAEQEETKGLVATNIQGNILIRGLTYHYPNREQPVLDRIEMTIKAGEIMALVGPRGGGKSTLGRLLTGLSQINPERDSGSILLDGIPVSQYEIHSLRTMIAGCPQDGMLFSRSILDNIRLATPNATDEQIVQAAVMACAHEWIIKTPGGYGAVLHEGGRTLSGGERHSLALARVILANPRIVFLDEPTAHFDPQSTQMFISNMQQWLKGKTAIIATHKPEIMMLAQKVGFFAGGKLMAIKHPNEMLGMFGLSGTKRMNGNNS